MLIFDECTRPKGTRRGGTARHDIIYSSLSIRLSRSAVHCTLDPEDVIIAFECRLQVLILQGKRYLCQKQTTKMALRQWQSTYIFIRASEYWQRCSWWIFIIALKCYNFKAVQMLISRNHSKILYATSLLNFNKYKRQLTTLKWYLKVWTRTARNLCVVPCNRQVRRKRNYSRFKKLGRNQSHQESTDHQPIHLDGEIIRGFSNLSWRRRKANWHHTMLLHKKSERGKS